MLMSGSAVTVDVDCMCVQCIVTVDVDCMCVQCIVDVDVCVCTVYS